LAPKHHLTHHPLAEYLKQKKENLQNTEEVIRIPSTKISNPNTNICSVVVD
jgi:hypothetical protein